MNAFEQYIYETYFDYGTSIREDCCDFIEGNISFKNLVKYTYNKPTEHLLLDWKTKYGVHGTKHMLWLLWKKQVDGLKKP